MKSIFLAALTLASLSAAIDLRLENDVETTAVSIPSEEPIQEALLSEHQPVVVVEEDNSVVLESEAAESYCGVCVPHVDKVLAGDALVDIYQTDIDKLLPIMIDGGECGTGTVFSTCIQIPDIAYATPEAIAFYLANIQYTIAPSKFLTSPSTTTATLYQIRNGVEDVLQQQRATVWRDTITGLFAFNTIREVLDGDKFEVRLHVDAGSWILIEAEARS